MKPYQFALLRYRHSAAAGELVNIGLVMLIPETHELLSHFDQRYRRLSRFIPEFDGAGYRQMVRAVAARAEQLAREVRENPRQILGGDSSDALENLKPSLVPLDASCFQWSDIMGGIAADPADRFHHLVAEFLTRHEPASQRQRQDETAISATIDRILTERDLHTRLESAVQVQGSRYHYSFKFGWHNGGRQVLEPISFDYLNAGDVLDKANTWSGRLLNLKDAVPFQFTGVVSRPTIKGLERPFDDAVALIKEAPSVRHVVFEEEFDKFVPQIEADLESSSILPTQHQTDAEVASGNDWATNTGVLPRSRTR